MAAAAASASRRQHFFRRSALETRHRLRSRLPLRLRRLADASGWIRRVPAAASWQGGRGHRRRHGRDRGGLRVDADGVEAGHLRGGKLAAGCVRRSSRAPRTLSPISAACAFRSLPAASIIMSISWAARPRPSRIPCRRPRDRPSSISRARRCSPGPRPIFRILYRAIAAATPRRWRSRPGSRPCRTRSATAIRRGSRASGTRSLRLGRSELLRFRRLLLRLRKPAFSVSRGVRPGRLRHWRLGFRLSELHARDPARLRHRMRRPPALLLGGVEQVPRRMWRLPRGMAHWPAGTSLEKLQMVRHARGLPGSPEFRRQIAVTDRWGATPPV